MVFDLIDPGGRGGHFIEIEHAGVEQALEVDVAVVALDNLGLGLNGTDNLADTAELVGRNF